MRMLLVSSLLFLSMNASFAEEQHPEVFIPHTTFNFGHVLAGKEVTTTFEIQNRGQAPLEISDIQTSCNCTIASLNQTRIPPGKNTFLEAAFYTEGRLGNQTNVISFKTNAPSQPKVELFITGVIQPHLSIYPEYIYFSPTASRSVDLLLNHSINPNFQIEVIRSSSSYVEVTPQTPLKQPNALQRFTIKLKEGYPHVQVDEKVAFYTNDPLQPILWIDVWGRSR